MCGIFGYLGTEKPNIDKFKILGLYNQIRGNQSTGVLLDKAVTKDSSYKNKLFSDFITSYQLDFKEGDRNFCMGHVRKASSGKIDNRSCQPFLYETKDKEVVFSFAHNGTLWNWKNNSNYVSDSEMLGHRLANGNKSILENYEGNAAFAGYDYRTEKLMLFRGAHKINGILSHERPMFIMQTENGTWFSSMENALKAIGNEKCIQIDHNAIYYIDKNKKIEIETINRTYTETTKNNYRVPKSTVRHLPSAQNVKKSSNDFLTETYKENEPNNFKGHVYFYRGRFHRNGKLLNGLVTVDETGAVYNKAPIRAFYKGFMLKEDSEMTFNQFKEKIEYIYKFASSIHVKARQISNIVDQPVMLEGSINSQLYLNDQMVMARHCPISVFGVRDVQIVYENFTYRVDHNKQTKYDVMNELSDEYWQQFDFDSLDFDSLTEEDWKFYIDKMSEIEDVEEYDATKENNIEEFDDEFAEGFYQFIRSLNDFCTILEDRKTYSSLTGVLREIETSDEVLEISDEFYKNFDKLKH